MSFVDHDLAELVGGTSDPGAEGPTSQRRGPGRPPGAKNKPRVPHPFLGTLASRRVERTAERIERAAEILGQHRAANASEGDEPPSMDLTDTFGGVTVYWLAKVFGMDPSTVKKRLADCPPMHKRKAGYTYSLPVACRFLVKPRFDVKKYVEEMNPNELPQQLQSEFWKARLTRQKFELNAGELWTSDAVMEVFGDVFKLIKFTTQLWADNLDQLTGLSLSQRQILTDAVDGLHKELHEKLVEMPRKKRTLSQLGEDRADAEPPETLEDDLAALV